MTRENKEENEKVLGALCDWFNTEVPTLAFSNPYFRPISNSEAEKQKQFSKIIQNLVNDQDWEPSNHILYSRIGFEKLNFELSYSVVYKKDRNGRMGIRAAFPEVYTEEEVEELGDEGSKKVTPISDHGMLDLIGCKLTEEGIKKKVKYIWLPSPHDTATISNSMELHDDRTKGFYYDHYYSLEAKIVLNVLDALEGLDLSVTFGKCIAPLERTDKQCGKLFFQLGDYGTKTCSDSCQYRMTKRKQRPSIRKRSAQNGRI